MANPSESSLNAPNPILNVKPTNIYVYAIVVSRENIRYTISLILFILF